MIRSGRAWVRLMLGSAERRWQKARQWSDRRQLWPGIDVGRQTSHPPFGHPLPLGGEGRVRGFGKTRRSLQPLLKPIGSEGGYFFESARFFEEVAGARDRHEFFLTLHALEGLLV